MTHDLGFESPSFSRRLKGMLGVDFYRLFHTPMFYIFLVIAAIIPAMVLAMTTMPDANGNVMEPLYSNVWQIIAASEPLYVVRSIADYANMNMVFIFGGIMVSIFIGHDYKSGYVKQLFTTHAKKQDYMMSKSIVCAFAMASMCITYLIGGVVGGMLAGYSLEVNVGSLFLAILGKMIMSLGWASLYTFLNVIFRRYFGVSIASSFFFGTGILIIGVAAVFDNLSLPTSFLNIFLYGSSVNACLVSNIGTLVTCIAVSFVWAVIYNVLGTLTVGNIFMCMFAKIFLMLVFISVFVLVSVAAKQKAWLSLCGSLGAGMLLFMMISVITPLDSTIINVILCLVGGALFATGLGAVSNVVLKKTSMV